MRLVPQGVPIQINDPAPAPLAQPTACPHPLGGRSFRLGPYQFFAVPAVSACISSAWSATIGFSRRFSSSS